MFLKQKMKLVLIIIYFTFISAMLAIFTYSVVYPDFEELDEQFYQNYPPFYIFWVIVGIIFFSYQAYRAKKPEPLLDDQEGEELEEATTHED